MQTIKFPQHVYVPNYGLKSSVCYQAGLAPNNTWENDEYGPNVSVIDTNTVKAFDQLINGEVTRWSTIETAELAVRAIVLHEKIYWIFPAVLIVTDKKVISDGGKVVIDQHGSIKYPNYSDQISIIDTLQAANVSSYSVFSGGLVTNNSGPQYGSKFWIENYDLLKSGSIAEINSLFSKSLSIPEFRNPYILSPKAIGAGSYLGSQMDRAYENMLTQELTPILRCPNHHIFFAPDLEPALECNL